MPDDWRSSSFEGHLGACHALEMPFVFDTQDIGEMEALLGNHPQQQIADVMHAAWVSFITHGNPGWPQYDLHHRTTMHFDTTSEVVKDLRADERALWEGLR